MNRHVVTLLAVLSLIFVWICMASISRTDPWYRNTDMNIHNVVDALSFNANVRPNQFSQPAVPLKYLLALDYRIRHELGILPVWNLKRLGASREPLLELPALIRIERAHSRFLVMIFILVAAGLVYSITHSMDSACFAVILLCGSSGLLFHGLLICPELLCVGFGNIVAFLCLWRAGACRSCGASHLWLFLVGALVGLATLENLPGICYLPLCYGWCWLAALLPSTAKPESRQDQAPFAGCLLAVVGSAAGFWLLYLLKDFHEALGPIVILRLRSLAALIALLPLLLLWPGPHRLGLFLLDRLQELALLGSGVLAAFLGSYLLVRGVMSEANAADYFSRVLHFLVNPAPYLVLLMDAKAEPGSAFLTFAKPGPLLFASATVVAVGVALIRSIPLRLRAFIVLQWACAVAMTLVMNKRHYLAQYDIFAQVPLLLVLSLGLFALGAWWREQHRSVTDHWAVPVMITASFVLMLTVWFRVQPIYKFYQNDADLPVNDLTLTFLFDHDAHPKTYLDLMKSHYGDRQHFSRALDHYLSDPANRY